MPGEPSLALGAIYELAVVAGAVAALRSARAPLRVGPWDPDGEALAATLGRLGATLAWRPSSWERLCEVVVTCGHLHGQTLADAWVRAHPGLRDVCVFAPGNAARGGVDPTREELRAALGVSPTTPLGAIYDTGGAARADLAVIGRRAEETALLVVECSLHLGEGKDGELPNPDGPGFWRRLVEEAAYRRLHVGGFANLRASVEDRVGVAFPAQLRGLYRALARDRGVSKLYQGCAYALALAPALAVDGQVPVRVTVAATTLRGFEHLAAVCPAPGAGSEPATWRLLRSCGELYPGFRETSAETHEELDRFDRVHELLRAGGTVVTDRPATAPAFGALDLRVEERLTHHPRLAQIRGEHNRLVRDFIARAPRGAVSVACLTGAPGIGKTTAIREALLGGKRGAPVVRGPWLYLYASPRIAINDEQFRSLAGGSGTCCLTANNVLAEVAAARGVRARGFACVAGDTRDLAVNGAPPDLRRQGRGTLLFDPDAVMAWERNAPTSSRERFHRETRDLVRTTTRPRQRVLAGLATAAREVLDARPDLERVVLALTLQALRAEAVDGLDALLSANARVDASWESSRDAALRFGRRFPLVCVMLDEVTGEEGSPAALTALRRWVDSRLVRPFRGADDAPRVLLLVSDASLTTARSIEQFLRHPDAPARVMVDEAPARPCPVERHDLDLSLGALQSDRVRCALIRGDGYPAEELTVGYRLVLARTGMGDGTLQGSLGAIATKRRDVILEAIVQTLRHELAGGGGQVLCFLQNKSVLDQVHARLSKEAVVADDDMLVLTADTSPAERKCLRNEEERDRLRLVLMTSSGTRGISFPRADRLLAFLSPFAPEQDLMEFVQFAWRGRGGGQEDVARRLEVVVVDAMEDRPGEGDALAVARRQADMAAFALTVRAALHTRIFGGYARGEGEYVAVVPVGRTGTEGGSWHLQRLLHDVSTAASRYGNEPTVKKLREAASAFFDHVQYESTVEPPRFRWDPAQPWTRGVPRLGGEARVRACGPLLVWETQVTDRAFFSGREIEELRDALRVFLGRARGDDCEKFTGVLVQAARKLDALLDEAAREAGAQQVVGLAAQAQGVMPICWEQAGDTLRSLGSDEAAWEAHAAWRNALEAWASLSAGGHGLDTGGRSRLYRRHPFLLVFDDVDLTDLREFGRRNIARAGAITNALAGLVLNADGAR